MIHLVNPENPVKVQSSLMYLTRVEKPHPPGENLTVAQMKRCVIICSIF